MPVTPTTDPHPRSIPGQRTPTSAGLNPASGPEETRLQAQPANLQFRSLETQTLILSSASPHARHIPSFPNFPTPNPPNPKPLPTLYSRHPPIQTVPQVVSSSRKDGSSRELPRRPQRHFCFLVGTFRVTDGHLLGRCLAVRILRSLSFQG